MSEAAIANIPFLPVWFRASKGLGLIVYLGLRRFRVLSCTRAEHLNQKQQVSDDILASLSLPRLDDESMRAA